MENEIAKKIALELDIALPQAQSAIALLDDGNTIPFIARYRKEATGGLTDDQLRMLYEKLISCRALEERREDVRRLIENLELLTDDISLALSKAATIAEIDDIYRPFRPKRRTRASIAVEKGLEPLAELILSQLADSDIHTEALSYISEEKGVSDSKEAIAGAMDIIAERVSDNPDFRKWIRNYTFNKGRLVTQAKTEDDSVYRTYYEYSENISTAASHRLLAIDRGEREGFLSVKIDIDTDWICSYLKSQMRRVPQAPSACFIEAAVCDAYSRLIAPSVNNELRSMLTESAQEQAMAVFAENLKHLLLQPPVRGRVVMGFDPAYRTGCKIAVVSDLGDVLDTCVVYPTPPQSKTAEASAKLTELILKHNVDIISIGNGTASKESEIFVAGLIKTIDRTVSYIMTSEAGASVYSASKLASEEFPQFDVSLRSAISIARRLQDPLAELVKIDPKSIGVGQYQHDMNPKQLSQTLGQVVQSCVSSVGADLNTASVPLLSQIAGISTKTAQSIYEYRTSSGRFKNRAELKKVKGIGPKSFTQCAGFLRVPESDELLDNTAVHPESYSAAKLLLKNIGLTAEEAAKGTEKDILNKIEWLGASKLAGEIGIGVPTLLDIAKELQKPGRDPRDSLPAPLLRSDIMDINSLAAGMELIGTVRNVADFGAFVDIGVHQDGLVHISKLSKQFVKRALDAVSIGDVIKVRVIQVDSDKNRISLERVFD